MTDAPRDNNQIPVILGTSNVDGSTPVPVKVNSGTHAILIDDGSGGSDLSDDIADRDNNGIPVLMGVSSADGVTPVAIYADPTTGELLVKSI